MRDPVRKPLGTTQPLPWENSPTGPATPLKREKRAYRFFTLTPSPGNCLMFLYFRKRKHLKSGLSRPTLPGLVTVGGLLLPAHVQVFSFLSPKTIRSEMVFDIIVNTGGS